MKTVTTNIPSIFQSSVIILEIKKMPSFLHHPNNITTMFFTLKFLQFNSKLPTGNDQTCTQQTGKELINRCKQHCTWIHQCLLKGLFELLAFDIPALSQIPVHLITHDHDSARLLPLLKGKSSFLGPLHCGQLSHLIIHNLLKLVQKSQECSTHRHHFRGSYL